MKDFLKNKVVTVFVVIATLILAGVAIFTALRLYQLRTEPVAPTAPDQPLARGVSGPVACKALAFSIVPESPTVTPIEELTPTISPTTALTPTLTPTLTLTPTPTEPPLGGPSSSPTPSVTPTAGPTTTPTPGQEQVSTPTPTPPGSTLPDAGVSTPTFIALGMGILIIVFSLLLAL